MAKKKDKVGIGIIGCGKISQAYFDGAKMFKVLNIVACADINMTAAKTKAAENGCQAQTVKALLANRKIDLVINLTLPAVHAEVSCQILQAGKHVHCEKPLAVTLEDGKAVLDLAHKKGLLVGCAPDTFLGAGLQTCRKLIDDGWIGNVTSGTAFMLSSGPESWHPNPGFYYLKGAGPMFDMGPYYLTALVHLLGPAKKVCAITSRATNERIATCKEHYGEKLPVEVPTHYSGTIEFHSGAVISATLSFDVRNSSHSPIELYGSQGTLKVPDPNTFGGPIEVFNTANSDWTPQAFSHQYHSNSRGIGAADMAHAILGNRPHRASGELAYHVLEIMHAFEKSSNNSRHVTIKSKPQRPAPLPPHLTYGLLD